MFYINATLSQDKMAVHGSMGEFCLQHYCRANDVFDDKTLAVLCSVCGLLMHKLIKYILMPRRLSDYLDSIVDLVKEHYSPKS